MIPLKWILQFYPPAWRQRYQAEMLALLEEHDVTWRTRLDLLRGALDARCDPYFRQLKGLLATEETLRLRHAHGTILWAFPLLVLGHFFFLDALDDVFLTWNSAHPALGTVKGIAGVLTATGAIAFLLTSLALAGLLARLAAHTSGRRAALLLGIGAVALAACGVYVCVPAALFWLALLGITAGPFALAFALARVDISAKFLGYGLASASLTAAGMVAQLFYTAFWGWTIWNVPAPKVQQMAQAADRPLWTGEGWRLQLLGGLCWTALMTGLVLWRLGRGLSGLMRKEMPEAQATPG